MGPTALRARSPLVAVYLAVFVDLLGFGLFLPSLPYWSAHFGASDAQVGLIQASYSLAQLVFVPLWGRLSDRIGRRTVMLVSMAGGVAAYLTFGLAPSLTWLFVARVASGAFAANIATAQALVADLLPAERRARGMGLVGASIGLGFTLGPPLGGLLAAGGHYARPAFAAALLCALNWVLAWRSLPKSMPAVAPAEPSPRARAAVWRDRRLTLLIAASLLVTFAFANFEQALVLVTRRIFDWEPAQNGLLMGFAGVVLVAVQGGGAGRLAGRIGERRMVAAGAGFMAAAFALLAMAGSPGLYWAAMVPLAVGYGLVTPALSSWLGRAAPIGQRGEVLGASQSAGALARVVAPAWAGWSLQHWSLAAPFLTGLALMALVGLVAAGQRGARSAAAAGV